MTGNDDIRMSRRRQHERIVRRLDEPKVLVQDSVDVPASFLDVSTDPTGEHEVGIAIDEDFEVEEVSQGVVLEGENAFDDDDGSSVDVLGFGQAGVSEEGVDGDLGALACSQLLEDLTVYQTERMTREEDELIVNLGSNQEAL
jgi:hypothetical protein